MTTDAQKMLWVLCTKCNMLEPTCDDAKPNNGQCYRWPQQPVHGLFSHEPGPERHPQWREILQQECQCDGNSRDCFEIEKRHDAESNQPVDHQYRKVLPRNAPVCATKQKYSQTQEGGSSHSADA